MAADVMSRLARLVASAELPITVALAPALMFPTPDRLKVLVVVPIIWFCNHLGGNRFIPHTPMNTALGLLLFMVGVSLYATFDIQFSLGKISGTVLGVLLFWACVRWLTTSERLKMAVLAFLLAGAGLAIVGSAGVTGPKARLLAQWAEHWALPLRHVVMDLPGLIVSGVNPNPLAGCLVLVVPLQIALLVCGRHWLQPLVATPTTQRIFTAVQMLLLLTTASTVYLTQSRGAWVGLTGAAVAILAWHSRQVRILTGCTTGIVLLSAATLGPNNLVSQISSWLGRDVASDISRRVELWWMGISGIQDFPFTGMGMNAFREIALLRYPLPHPAPYEGYPHAHNHLLQAALDVGIPGLIAYASLWLVAAFLLGTVGRHSKQQIYRIMANGLAAGLIAHFIFGLTDAIPLGAKIGVFFWFALALVVGLYRVAGIPLRANSHIGKR